MQTLTRNQEQLVALMRRLRYFREIPRPDLERLAGGADQIALSGAEILYRDGAKVAFVSIVISGQLKLCAPTGNGGTKLLAIAKREDSFGEPEVLLGQASPATVAAVNDCHLLIVDGKLLLQELQRCPLLAISALRSVSLQLRNLVLDNQLSHTRSSTERVLGYLRRHSECTDSGEWVHTFPALKRDIAAKLSMTPESFSRALRGLERHGVVSVSGREVRILNPAESSGAQN